MEIDIKVEKGQEEFDSFEYLVSTAMGPSVAMIYGQEKENDAFSSPILIKEKKVDLKKMNGGNWPNINGKFEIDGSQYNEDVNSFANEQSLLSGHYTSVMKDLDKSKIGILMYLSDGGSVIDSLENLENRFGISYN